MSQTSASSVIRKKASHGREELDARGMSPSKALRLSLERGADRLFGLELVVRAVEQRRIPLSAIPEAVGGDRLVMLLEGPGGARGGALLERDVVQALLEVQTMGRVRPGAAPERAFTGTDAAITAPLVEAMLRGLDEKLAAAGVGHSPGRYCFGDRLADMRGLMLALEDQDYELFQITADIGKGAKSGVLCVLLPFTALNPPRDKGHRTGAGGGDLRAIALSAPVTLDAVLTRIELPLSQLWKLAPGMLLPVPAQAIARTELVAAEGHVAATGRLGQVNGLRAVRLEISGPTEAPLAGQEAGSPADPAREPSRHVTAPPSAAGRTGAGQKKTAREGKAATPSAGGAGETASPDSAAMAPAAARPAAGGDDQPPPPAAQQPSVSDARVSAQGPDRPAGLLAAAGLASGN